MEFGSCGRKCYNTGFSSRSNKAVFCPPTAGGDRKDTEVACGFEAHHSAQTASWKYGNEGCWEVKRCHVLQDSWLCVSSSFKPNSDLVELRYSNKQLLSERQSSMKIPLAKQRGGRLLGGWGICLIMHKI